MGHTTKRIKKGFTIIEVMIVLAIAGLIMLIVLIAIPQLQRNQRNTARKDILGRVKTELDSFSGNNNGNYPNPNASGGTGGTPLRQNIGRPGVDNTFFSRYLGCPNTSTAPVVCDVNILDPSSGSAIGTGQIKGSNVEFAVGVNAPATIPTVVGSVTYSTRTVCAGETLTAQDASARNYALTINLEGGAVFCLDNR